MAFDSAFAQNQPANKKAETTKAAVVVENRIHVTCQKTNGRSKAPIALCMSFGSTVL